MRDRADNCVIICSIENVDPMGVHTGDSITVAPAQTLTDVEYQAMRDAAFACIRRVGVETGGSNVQFALDPVDRPDGRHRDEPAGLPQSARWRRRRPASRSPRSPPASPSATRSTRSPTTSPRPRRPASSRSSTTSSRRSRAGRSRSCPARPACSAPRCSRSARRWRSGARSRRACRRRCARWSRVASGLNADPAEAQLDDARRRRPAGGRSPCRPRTARSRSASCCGAASTLERDPRRLPHRPVVPRPDAGDHRGAPRPRRAGRPRRPRAPAAGSGPSGSASPTPSSPTCGASTRPTVRAARQAAGVHPTYKTVDTCAAEFAAATPYHYST